jgi:hypothetical protein
VGRICAALLAVSSVIASADTAGALTVTMTPNPVWGEMPDGTWSGVELVGYAQGSGDIDLQFQVIGSWPGSLVGLSFSCSHIEGAGSLLLTGDVRALLTYLGENSAAFQFLPAVEPDRVSDIMYLTFSELPPHPTVIRGIRTGGDGKRVGRRRILQVAALQWDIDLVTDSYGCASVSCFPWYRVCFLYPSQFPAGRGNSRRFRMRSGRTLS